jgi:alpha-galactosidase
VNHLPVVTALRIAGEDGFTMLRDLLADPSKLEGEPVWMAPPAQSHWRKLDPGRDWTKADIFANLRLKLSVFERFGVLPGSADTHVAEFFPWFVTAASDYGRDWGVHHYGLAGHREDKADDDAGVVSLLQSDEIPAWPSGELVAPLIDGVMTGADRALPVNLPNTGQVSNLEQGSVVECIGVAGAAGVRPRDVVTIPSVVGEFVRRVAVSQELTVEAALTGSRSTVLQAVLADPFAGQLPFEHAVAMTDELLDATSPWLDRF